MTPTKHQAEYRRRKAEHRCGRCGCELPEDHAYVCCDACRAYGADAYETRVQASVCGRCSADLDDPRYLNCGACRKAARARVRARERRFLADGQCRHCGQPPVPGGTSCVKCRKQRTTWATETYHLRKMRESA